MCTLLNREFVVDLVGDPGNVHGPDSSINGGVLSPAPSPFQIPHLREYQQGLVDDVSFCQIMKSKNAFAPRNLVHPGIFSTFIHKLFQSSSIFMLGELQRFLNDFSTIHIPKHR